MPGVSVPARRIVGGLVVLLLAALLYGGSPVDSLSPLAGAQARPTFTPPRGHATSTPPPHARPTHTPRGPRPKPTDPYPAGAVEPIAPDVDSFFVVAETFPEPDDGAGTTTAILWIGIALTAMVFAFRWFVRATVDRG